MDFHGPTLSPVLFGSHLLLVDIISARVSPEWNAKPRKGHGGLSLCCAIPFSYALKAVIRTCRTTQKNGCFTLHPAFIVQSLKIDAQRLVSGSEYTVHWSLPEASSSCQADHLANVSKYLHFYYRLSFLFLLVHTVWRSVMEILFQPARLSGREEADVIRFFHSRCLFKFGKLRKFFIRKRWCNEMCPSLEVLHNRLSTFHL